MATDENPKPEEVNVDQAASNTIETGLTLVKGPAPPKGLSDEEVEKVRGEAAALVKQLGDTSGSKQLEALDNLSNVGIQTQRTAAGNLDLLKARVGTVINQGGSGREIGDSMRDLRIELDKIDPSKSPRTVWDWFYNIVPVGGGRNPVRILQKIAMKYEPVSRQVVLIETRLREGRTMLVRDNVELRKLYEQIEAQQPAVQRSAYLGELLMQQLTELLEHTPDAIKREKIRGALHDVAMRVQDLRTMEEVHVQYFVSIEMSRQNNNRLGQAVDRTLTLSTNVITVGLAIQSALVRQEAVMEATRRTREFLGKVITANAAAIKRHTQEIGDLYTHPVIAMDKITQAHNDLIEAMDIADGLRTEGIQVARENIARLTELSANLMQRAGGLLQEAKGQPGSAEKMGAAPERPALENKG
ncbi:MAG: toxic anion resistance protein [Chloroflexi bacterium]|nr:toxic anion resistance protein [Chloroflexota bacterium]